MQPTVPIIIKYQDSLSRRCLVLNRDFKIAFVIVCIIVFTSTSVFSLSKDDSDNNVFAQDNNTTVMVDIFKKLRAWGCLNFLTKLKRALPSKQHSAQILYLSK
jgi:hypothetical protein